MDEKEERLWTPSFLILWQGQLVSIAGDAVYSIALGFWVLDATGSTAMMGALMAASTLPGVLVSPFAGVLIDRADKKRLFILTDLVRGTFVALLAAAAYRGMLEIWMVFAAGILLSVCGAVFSPGIQSAVPDLVPRSKISNANSAFSVVTSGSNMIGSVAGGFLYQALGAPALFLFDGLSFLFSGATLPFVKIPNGAKKKEKTQFFADMADGFRYLWRQRGLRIILAAAACSNFFSFIGIVLLLPFCQATPFLGAGRYGVVMGSYMAGAMAGFLFLSAVTVKAERRTAVFAAAGAACCLCAVAAVNVGFFPAMVALIVFAGFANSMVNVLLISAVQISTPQEVRGKVLSFMNMITQGLTPFAMALGGVLGQVLPIRPVISGAFLATLAVLLSADLAASFRAFLRADAPAA